MPKMPIQQLPEEEDDWEDKLIEEYSEKNRKPPVLKRPKSSEWLDDALRGKRGKKATN